eukprot:CAMPEP_0176044960 /NCGR_PEP_ID=MMETSP0120_2-20121206/22316_1 /TAXON_ID=160619 /ORGANISM="Kryptoperidinium foliaceum, Strain CCMP 1326" /LENGTH=823 /DNA_ID=CAMNT_0017378365 /DNA_START=84 /DNA_END=2555 /DNA_ORIENTATION=-
MSVWKSSLVAGIVLSAHSSAVPEGSGCVGDCAVGKGHLALDEMSMLAFRRQVLPQAIQQPEAPALLELGGGKCWGSDDTCEPNTCCKGVKFTTGKTLPCPSSEPTFRGCEVNDEGEIVDALLNAMTRTEKYRMLRGVGWQNNSWNTLDGYYIGNSGAQERFGIPSLNMQDNGQGFRTVTKDIIEQVTGWPCTLAITSSWSEEDTELWAEALGKEFRAKGANVILGPGVNVHRVARGGRNAEYNSGESPYLGKRLTPPYVQGVQSQSVLAVMKHFIGNNQETNRGSVDAIIDERTLWEVYYPPFKAAVDAGAASAMCSYNKINGKHACGNSENLIKDLKGTMGFEGFVMSDWWALHSFAAEDGVDQEMPGTFTPSIEAFFTDKNLDTLSDAKIDDMTRRQLVMMLRYGLFENPVCQPPDCDQELYRAVATSPQHKQLNLRLATNAVTLLKNEAKVLPLSKKHSTKIALIGPACDAKQDVDRQLDDWMAGSYYNIGGSGRVIAGNVTTILAGVKAKCAEDGAGCVVQAYNGTDVKEALAFVKASAPSVVLICGGAMSTEGKDRDSLSVDNEDLLTGVAKGVADVPVVALTMVPAQTLMPWADDVHGALNVFLAGTYTGDAFASALFGDSNPSAKLPVTMPKSEADTILPCEGATCEYSEKLMVGFPAYQGKEVAFPFGHGLSYTTFTYSSLQAVVTASADGAVSGDLPSDCFATLVCISATVANKGSVSGVEVAQLYVEFPESAGEPPLLLKGFVRTQELPPGGEVKVTFPLYHSDLQVYAGRSEGWKSVDGLFKFYVGSSSRDIRLSGELELSDHEGPSPQWAP